MHTQLLNEHKTVKNTFTQDYNSCSGARLHSNPHSDEVACAAAFHLDARGPHSLGCSSPPGPISQPFDFARWLFPLSGPTVPTCCPGRLEVLVLNSRPASTRSSLQPCDCAGVFLTSSFSHSCIHLFKPKKKKKFKHLLWTRQHSVSVGWSRQTANRTWR